MPRIHSSREQKSMGGEVMLESPKCPKTGRQTDGEKERRKIVRMWDVNTLAQHVLEKRKRKIEEIQNEDVGPFCDLRIFHFVRIHLFRLKFGKFDGKIFKIKWNQFHERK